jgi:hypothetical protein
MNYLETKNYSIFKKIALNRDLRDRPKLYKSMKEHGQLIPIMVDVNFNVIDGQHRLNFCKELNIPVKYQVTDLETKHIFEINNNAKVWRPIDYLQGAVKKGHVNGAVILDIINKSKNKHGDFGRICAAYSVGAGNVVRSCKGYLGLSGDDKKGVSFPVNKTVGDALMDIVNHIEDVKGFQISHQSISFLRILINHNSDISLSHLKDTLAENQWHDKLKSEMFYPQIVNLYNKKTRKKIQVPVF